MSALKWMVVGCAGAAILLASWLVWVFAMGIPLTVEVRGGEVLVDTQVFGEYYSAISRIRLTEIATGRTVWEVESTSASGVSPVWTFHLESGKNLRPERLEEFRTVVPRDSAAFEIAPGDEYRIRVWGKTRLNRNSRRFAAPKPVAQSGATHNYRLNPTVGAVTALAKSARAAPVPPAG